MMLFKRSRVSPGQAFGGLEDEPQVREGSRV
jgi:hypothetical protein